MAVVEVPMSDAMRGVTIEVVLIGQRRARFRTWLGGRMMVAAAWVMGCGIEISAEPTDAEVITYQSLGGGQQQFVIGRRVRHQG